MARIPLQTAQRSLDTGQVVQYPDGSPIGSALEGAGSALQGVALRVQQKQDQKDDFDARIRENEMTQTLAGMEDQAVQSAPEDASGLHDSTYGQMTPDGHVAKPGSFDKVFDDYLERMPKSRRADFAAKRELYRMQGSNRMAAAQYKGEQAYYGVQIQKTQNQIVNSMLAGDPNDIKTFEQFKKQGTDVINASGLPQLEKDVARTNWEANASETLFKLKLAKDPGFAEKARGALGLAPAGSGNAVTTVVDRIIGVESGGKANAKNPNSSASGVGQFLDSTWVNTIRQHRPDIAAGKSAAQIIALKSDPVLGREMTEAFTRDNAEYLTNRGVQTTAGNLYLAHFLGAGGAVEVLKADPNASIASVVGQDVMRANPFLAGKTVADTIAWSDKKMGGGGAVQADPAFANIPPDRRLVLANQADVQVNEQQRKDLADQNAQYAAYKDALELQIVQGKVRDDAIISNDNTLTDGDKATLLRSVHSQNQTAGQIQADLSALNDRTLVLDPYSSDDKKRVDNLFADAATRVPADQQAALAGKIIEQTGVVPQPVVNTIRKGLASTTATDVLTAVQTAQRISTFDPAALARRDGGGEVQKAADDFSYYVNSLNMSPEDAARRLVENRDPEKQRARKAIEPAAKEFVKSLQDFDLAGQFNDSWFGGDPSLGFTPSQELGIKADFLAIAEDQFYQANGDPELAKNRAIEQMKRLYGVTTFGGANAVVKHPPERYWPKSSYQAPEPQSRIGGSGGQGPGNVMGGMKAEPSLDYAKNQLEAEVKKAAPGADMSTIELVTTPGTDAQVKRGELPGYSVLYKDENGNYQTVQPGKLWRPDVSQAIASQKAAEEKAASEAADYAKRLQTQERQQLPYRTQTPQDFLSGNDPTFGARDLPEAAAPKPTKPQTLGNRLKDDQAKLFERAKENGLSPSDVLSGNDAVFGAR